MLLAETLQAKSIKKKATPSIPCDLKTWRLKQFHASESRQTMK